VRSSSDVRWPVRPLSAALTEAYVQQGWWTDDTLGLLVDRSLRATPNALVRVWSETRPWTGTYADLHAEASRLARGLRDAGIEPGDAVAFQLPNWREAMVAFHGLALGGYVLVPIVHIYGHKEVRFILDESKARAYISTDRFGHVDYLDVIDNAEPSTFTDLALHVVVGAEHGNDGRVARMSWDDATRAAASSDNVEPADPNEVCVLAYTSGTTSVPKGVMHTHRTLLAELRHMLPWMTPGMPNLMASPVTHATGMLGAALGPIQLGEDIHLIDRWDPSRALDIVLEAGIGAGTGASVFLASLLSHPDFTPEHAQRIHRVGLGGAPVPRALGERAAAHDIAIIRAYGSTEHPSTTGSSFDDPFEKRVATDGRALPGVEIRLVDDDGYDVATGSPGEIWSRGPDLCVGYVDPALNDAVFDDDGWYHTGDIGIIDVDGYVTITDRRKDVIIRGGENISPAEIEAALSELSEIAEVAVVAVPDARLGEQACAVVRLADETKPIDLATLNAHLERCGLARQKWPEQLMLVADFPRTASGKIRKVDLRQQLRDGAS
jgi:acyl-CoA synthetase (AMP-forming)/AMP-acid ligase II